MNSRERLAKWRAVFAGWQLGTRAKGDPECDAVRDHREVTILMRAELNALVGLLLKKGVFTAQEFTDQLEEEAEFLSKCYEKKFPGFKASDIGIEMNIALARDTMQGWRP
jgi:hypothetical protein